MAEIYIKTYVTNINRGTVASQTFDRTNVSSGSSVGAKSCSEGGNTFKSNADVLVHFPAEYTPTPQVTHAASARFALTCGNSLAPTLADPAAMDAPNRGFGATEWTITATKG